MQFTRRLPSPVAFAIQLARHFGVTDQAVERAVSKASPSVLGQRTPLWVERLRNEQARLDAEEVMR